MRLILEQEEEGLVELQDQHLGAEQKQLRQRLEQIQRQFLTGADMVTRQLMEEDEFVLLREKLVGERKKVQERLSQVELALTRQQQRQGEVSQVQTLISEFPKVWKHLDFAERRAVLVHLVEKLTLDKSEDGKTPLLTMKVLLLPEITVPLVQAPPDRKRKFSKGVAALTPRHLALLYWLGQGKTLAEAAAVMAVTDNCLRTHQTHIRRLLEVQDFGECIAKSCARIHAEFSTLPLYGLRGPQAKVEGGVYLSATLLEVLPLYASGAQTKEIGEMLGLPEGTVSQRRHRILQTLHVKTIYEAVQKARKAGLI